MAAREVDVVFRSSSGIAGDSLEGSSLPPSHIHGRPPPIIVLLFAGLSAARPRYAVLCALAALPWHQAALQDGLVLVPSQHRPHQTHSITVSRQLTISYTAVL